jgi:hypothetical protein
MFLSFHARHHQNQRSFDEEAETGTIWDVQSTARQAIQSCQISSVDFQPY